VGMDRVVTAVFGADRPRRAGITGAGVERVVGAFAERLTDGVDRREVDDVEAHCGNCREPLGRSLERPRQWRVEARAFGTGEELVPRADEGPLAIDAQC